MYACRVYVTIVTGTAAVAVAGLIASMRKCGTRLADHKYLFQGAGEVGGALLSC
jgi:malic enzyme